MALGALIGAIRVSLSAETSAFEAGMTRAQRQARQTASSIKGSFGGLGGIFGTLKAGVAGFIGALTVGSVIAAGRAALEYAGSLGEIAQQLGVTTRDLQVFRFAAGQVGVSQTQLETGLSKLTITLGKVAAGAKAPIAALNAIGISVDQLKGKDTGEAFRIIADGLQNVTDRSQRAAVEVALFGKSGAQLDNLLAGGSSAVNELAQAADKLGIVLSNEQIQKADETADKLEAMKTVLSARIAGIVADNSDAILGLADALADLVRSISDALRAWANFRAQMNAGLLQLQGMEREAARARGSAFESGEVRVRDGKVQFGAGGNPSQRGRSVTIKLGAARLPPEPKPIGGDIGRFLGSGGGGGRKGRSGRDKAEELERKRLEALREANQFDQEIRRAKIDVLRAEQDLAPHYIERTSIAVQILDAEREAFQEQLKYEVAAKERTQVQADQLLLEYDRKDALERQKLVEDEQAQRFEDSARLDAVTLDIQREALEAQAQLAETAKDRRAIELRLLDLAYEQERVRLETIIADKQSSEAAKEEARRRLNGLNATFAADRQGVINRTRGPMEEWRAQFSDIGEELESLQVDGIMGAVDALTALTQGWDAFRDAAISNIGQVLQELIRLQLTKAAVDLFGGAPTQAAQGVGAGLLGGGAGGEAAQGAQLAAAGSTLMAAAAPLNTAGATLTAAGTSLSTAGPTLMTAGPPLSGAGLGLNSAAVSLNASAVVWTATAAQIMAAAVMLQAANAAGGVAGGGFQGGGYTGNIGVKEIAGFVHGREFVINAEATKQFLPLLEAINTGKITGMAAGGLVGNVRIPRTIMNERININDNEQTSARHFGDIHFHLASGMSRREARETGLQAASAFRGQVARATKVGV